MHSAIFKPNARTTVFHQDSTAICTSCYIQLWHFCKSQLCPFRSIFLFIPDINTCGFSIQMQRMSLSYNLHNVSITVDFPIHGLIGCDGGVFPEGIQELALANPLIRINLVVGLITRHGAGKRIHHLWCIAAYPRIRVKANKSFRQHSTLGGQAIGYPYFTDQFSFRRIGIGDLLG